MTIIKKYPEYILLFLFAIIGITSANAYGFAWDEYEQRNIGEICFNYVFNNNLYYLQYPARDHGAIFEFLLLIIEKIINISDNRSIYLMRHIVTHLFFLLSAFYFYKLIFLNYSNKKIALLGFLLLVIHPTIYGHSFFNSKDVPFLSMFIICFYQFAIAFKNKKYHQFVFLGMFTGFLINIRIMGIMFAAFVVFFLLLDLFIYKKEKGLIKKHIFLILLFISAVLITTIATWPLLWQNPLQNFLWSFNNLSKYPWDGTMLFNGEFIDHQTMRWNYIPTWFCINTPILYLILGFCGLILFVITTLKAIKTFNLKGIDKNNLLYLFSFIAPVLVVIILHSVLYDTWRHLFYIYPAFIMLAIYFINFYMNTKYKIVISTITVISITTVSYFIISNFPFHHVYFNQFVSLHKGEYIRKNYEIDYWGVSYNKALEYVLETDDSDTIRIAADNGTVIPNSWMLFENQKKRIIFVDSIHKSDYFIATYRWHPQNYDSKNLEEIKSFIVLNSKINTIFKVKK